MSKHVRYLDLQSRLKKTKRLDNILKILNIPDDWDYVIICDGSATTWKETAGWGWTAIWRKPTFGRFDGSGGASCGSNIFAEIMGFLHPLLWLEQQKPRGRTKVYAITDCEVVKRWGNQEVAQHSYEELFFYIRALARKGILVEYRWAPRDTIDLNKFAHTMANCDRILHKRYMPILRRKTLEKLGVSTIFKLNRID